VYLVALSETFSVKINSNNYLKCCKKNTKDHQAGLPNKVQKSSTKISNETYILFKRSAIIKHLPSVLSEKLLPIKIIYGVNVARIALYIFLNFASHTQRKTEQVQQTTAFYKSTGEVL